VRSGRQAQRSFETVTGQLPMSTGPLTIEHVQSHINEIQDLRAEVALLKALLSKTSLEHYTKRSEGTIRDNAEYVQTVLVNDNPEADQGPAYVANTEISDPRQRSQSGYYKQHTLLQFFVEVNHTVSYFAGMLLIYCSRFHSSFHSSKKLRMNGSSLSGSI
jgi:hypothetical protein